MSFRKIFTNQKSALFCTICLWISFFLYGVAFSLPGSSLFDLQILMKKEFATICLILAVRAAGFTIGAFSGIHWRIKFWYWFLCALFLVSFLEKFLSIQLITAFSLLFFGGAIIYLPFSEDLMIMQMTAFFIGINQALIDVGMWTSEGLLSTISWDNFSFQERKNIFFHFGKKKQQILCQFLACLSALVARLDL